MKTLRMKQAVAAGLIGLTAFGAVAVAPSIAEAQDDTTQEERQARRAERRANREVRRAERIALLTDALGIDADALKAARQAGQSLADIADAQGVPVETVIDAIVEAKTAHIQEHVAAGNISQADADERIAGLEERVTERVNSEPGERGERFRGRRGHRGPASADTGEA